MSVSFNYTNTRARKARINRFFSKRSLVFLKGLTVLLLLAGGVILLLGSRFGAILIAVGLDILILLLWQKFDLNVLASNAEPNNEKIELEKALNQELLAVLPRQFDAEKIWNLAFHHWHGQFMSVRYGVVNAFVNKTELNAIEPDHVWEDAYKLSIKYRLNGITPAVVLVAIFLRLPSSAQALNSLHLSQEEFEDSIKWIKYAEDVAASAKKKENFGGLGRDWAAGYTPQLNRIARNISQEVQHGFWVKETESHNQLVDQLIQTLSKSRSSSVALVGETGVGKTTSIYALAKKLLTEKVPALRYNQVFALDASVLIANTGNYQSLEQLLLRVFGEAATAGNIILFLDEAQAFMGTGTGAIDMSNVLTQVLQSGRVRLICAFDPVHWQTISSKNSALAGLFSYQIMKPPTRSDSLQIMQDQLITIEHKNKVRFTYQALSEAYRLAEKYISGQEFPGRGVRVLEETAVFAKSGLVTEDTVGMAMESKLGIKITQASGAEREQLLNLEDELHKRLINQTRAVSVVSNALRRARSGVNNPNRPMGTFLFLGPTGVGKTELAKALAEVYFRGRDQVIRVNLNEFSQSSDTSRLIAAVGDGEGANSLLAQIRRQPYSVVLLDEIEKAHDEVLNVLLQLLDEGVLRDVGGKEASFRDAIVIATSNAGADKIRAYIDAGKDILDFEEEFTNQLIDDNFFKPEFINRFDEVVLFRPLKPDELAQVVKLMIGEVNQNLERQKVSVMLDDEAIAWLVEKGNDPRLGARPMRRMVQRSVENIVAKKLLDGSASAGSKISLGVNELESESTGQANNLRT